MEVMPRQAHNGLRKPESTAGTSDPPEHRRRRLLPSTIQGMLLLLLASAIIPILLVQTGLDYNRLQGRRTAESQANLELARAVAANLEGYVQDVLRQELALGRLFTLARPPSAEETRELLAVSAGEYPSVRAFSWTDPGGRILHSSNPAVVGVDIGDRPYFQQILHGQEWVVSDVVAGRSSGENTAVIVRGLRGPDGYLLGTVMARISTEDLGDALAIERFRQGSLSILDRQGNIVYASPSGDIPALGPRNEVGGRSLVPRAILERVHGGQEFNGTFAFETDGREQTAGLVPIRSLGWMALASRPVDEAMGHVVGDLLRDFGLTFLVAACAALSALAMGRVITRPMRLLREHALAVGGGEIGRLVEVAGPDELEQLGSAFNRMAREIAIRERQREQLLKQLREANQQLVIEGLRIRGLVTQTEEAREELQAIMDHTRTHLAYLDAAFNFVQVNSAFVQGSGLTEIEILGRNHFDVYPNAENQAIFERVRDTGRPVEFRAKPFEYADQPERGVTYRDWTLVPVKDSAGAVRALVLSVLDVTEQVRAQEALRASEQAQRFLAETGSLLASSLDYEKTLQSVAQLAVPLLAEGCLIDLIEEGKLRLVGVAHVDPSKAALASDLRRRFPPDANGSHPEWEAIRTGKTHSCPHLADDQLERIAQDAEQLALLRSAEIRGGAVVPMTARGRTLGAISLFVSPAGEPKGVNLDLAEELARRAAMAVDNARLYQEAREAVADRDEFLSVAAHELKTPITSLRGFAQLTVRRLDREGLVDPVRLRQALQVIDEQSDKLSRLVSQLLDISRIEAGRLSLAPRVTDLARLAADVVSAGQAGTTIHTITLNAEPSIQATVDPLRMEQVLTNLIDNAIKYSPDGGRIEVELSSRESETVQLRVTDQGIGIQAEQQSRIFDRFYQAHGYFGGMGLGLFISREIVNLHGGRIEVESPAAGGSSFIVTLPTRGPR